MSQKLFYCLLLALLCVHAKSQKLDVQGGPGGIEFDDGVFDGVTKVYVGNGFFPCIGYVKFDYINGSNIVSSEHGVRVQEPQEFALEHPHEYITSVEGTYDLIGVYANNIVTSLTFKTSKKRTSPTFGFTTGTKFVLEVSGKKKSKLVGFHGRAGEALDAIGAYFAQK